MKNKELKTEELTWDKIMEDNKKASRKSVIIFAIIMILFGVLFMLILTDCPPIKINLW